MFGSFSYSRNNSYLSLFFLCRQFGFLPVMFEASSLQLFKLGRIEHLRTVTEESVDFIKTFTDKDLKVSLRISSTH